MPQNNYFLYSVLLFLFFSCAGGKDVLFEQDPPFQIKKATAQNWVAGTQGGGSGTIVSIYMGLIHDDLLIKDLYFGEGVAKAEQDKRNIDKYVGRFDSEMNRDIIMSDRPEEESQNTPPVKSPFSLEENEVVISYFHDGEVKFYKYSEVEEKPIIAYPGTKPNGLND